MPEKETVGKTMAPVPSIMDFLAFAWARKAWLVLSMIAAVGSGLLIAFLTEPQYMASAVIAPKDPPKAFSASGLLSQIGAGGGMGQLLGAGGASMAKLEYFLEGLDLAMTVIQDHDLLPVLYRDRWDSAKGEWRSGAVPPSPRLAAERLRKSVLDVTPNTRQNVITVSATFRDSVAAKKIVEFYILELNRKIRDEVVLESETNRAYLDSQMINSADPVLRQKIQELIGMEIEKAMLVSTRSVEILVKPSVPIERIKPKRKNILITSFGLGLSLFAIGCVLAFFLAGNLETIRGRLSLQPAGRPA